MRFRPNNSRFWFLTSAGAVLIVLGAMLVYVPFVITQVKNPVAGFFNDTLLHVIPPDFARYGLKGENFTWRTDDSLLMSGYRIKGADPVKGTVVALHGYRSNKNKYLPVASHFVRAGYDFIAVDLRGHNMSEGDYTGFSYKEKYDMENLLDYLHGQGWLRGNLILYGHSIGAATALETAVRRKEIKALVLESLFADFRDILPNYIAYYTGISPDTIPGGAEDLIFSSVNIPVDSIRPVDRADSLHIPVLLIHGGADKKVPLKHAKLIYSRLHAPKKLIVIDSATHNTLWEKGGKNYFSDIIRFLDKYSAP